MGKDVLYFPPHLKLKTKTETKNEIFKVIYSVLCFLLPFSPQYLHGRYSIPSPESRPRSAPTAPRSRFHGSPEPARSPTDPASSSLHGSRDTRGSPGYPHGLRRLLVPEDPSVTPPRQNGGHAPVPLPQAVSIKSPSGCSCYSGLCLVVWVVPAVHSRPQVSWVLSAAFRITQPDLS